MTSHTLNATDDAPAGTSLPTPVRRKRPAAPAEAARPVTLVGLPGSGKSTVARLLAEQLGRRWVDLDDRIEAVSGHSIPELFERGEEHFRNIETEVLRGVLAVPTEVVVATGGGIVTSEANRATLATRSTVVWLDVPVEQLLDRLGSDATDRPLLSDGDPALRLAELADARRPLYEATTAHRVDATGSPAEVVDEVAALLKAPTLPDDAVRSAPVAGGTDR